MIKVTFEQRERAARRAWEEYCRSGNKPADIPARPDLVYHTEWKGWQDWLGQQPSPVDNK